MRVETVEGIPAARLGAIPVFADAVPLVTTLIRQLVAQGEPHLLMDARLVRFGAPSLVERLGMMREWADATQGRVRIALLTRPEHIDPERFGIVAAGNFGLAAHVFDVEADAIDWLRAERAADLCRAANSGPGK